MSNKFSAFRHSIAQRRFRTACDGLPRINNGSLPVKSENAVTLRDTRIFAGPVSRHRERCKDAEGMGKPRRFATTPGNGGFFSQG